MIHLMKSQGLSSLPGDVVSGLHESLHLKPVRKSCLMSHEEEAAVGAMADYGVPLRSKYPDSEMLFQNQNISRDLQNMMRKLYFIDPDQKKFEFHFSIIRLPMEKKNSRSKIR